MPGLLCQLPLVGSHIRETNVGPSTSDARTQVPFVVSEPSETKPACVRACVRSTWNKDCVRACSTFCVPRSVFHAVWAPYLRTSVAYYCTIALQHPQKQRPEAVSENRTPSLPFRRFSPVKRESRNICFIQVEPLSSSLNYLTAVPGRARMCTWTLPCPSWFLRA